VVAIFYGWGKMEIVSRSSCWSDLAAASWNICNAQTIDVQNAFTNMNGAMQKPSLDWRKLDLTCPSQ
jgi:hypothetical protein